MHESPAFWRLFLRQKTSLILLSSTSCEDATVGRKGNFLHTTITFTFVEPEPGRTECTAAFPLSEMLLLLESSQALLGIFENLVYIAPVW